MRLHLARLVWLANKIKMASDQICIRFMAELYEHNTGGISTVSRTVRYGWDNVGQNE